MMGLLSVSISLSPHIPMGTGAASFSSSGGPSSSASSILSRQPHVVAFRPPLSTFSIFGRSLPEHNNSKQRRGQQVVRMAPEEEKMTRRSPLDFPIEWERPKPGRRPDIFPQFSPMKTPLPPPLPADPPEEDEEEEEEKKEEDEEDPEKEEDPDKPEQ